MQNDPQDTDHVLTACPLGALQALVEVLERQHAVKVIKAPDICLTMIRAEDSLEKQEFYLGEALTSECEVSVDDQAGYGLCLGEEPVRAYCIAVVDSLIHSGREVPYLVAEFLHRQREELEQREREEFSHILRTQVDFKLMEQD